MVSTEYGRIRYYFQVSIWFDYHLAPDKCFIHFLFTISLAVMGHQILLSFFWLVGFVLFPFLVISDDQSQKLRKEENLGNILLKLLLFCFMTDFLSDINFLSDNLSDYCNLFLGWEME